MNAKAPKPDWPASKVATVSVDSLVPAARNVRTHSDDQVEQIAAAIKEWGWTVPVLIDEENNLIAGHGRVMAAKSLGLESVPAVVAKGWSEAQKKAYLIADNKITLNGGWDQRALSLELADLKAIDFNLDLMGFNEQELFSALLEKQTGANDANAEWQGMPEFDQQDKSSFRSIQMHFKDQAAVDEFAALVGNKITDKTRFMWFPYIEIETYADKRWAVEPDAKK